MKKFLTICLAGLAAAAFAAETAVEIKAKKDVMGWGANSYYQTPPVVTVADGTAKVECGKTVEGAKPSRYQFGALSKMTFKAGVTYKITFTVKSSKPLSGDANFQLSGAPYTVFARVPVKLNANEPKSFEIVCTPKADIAALTRVPGLHFAMTEGQTVELSDVKIAEAAAE